VIPLLVILKLDPTGAEWSAARKAIHQFLNGLTDGVDFITFRKLHSRLSTTIASLMG
jgi:hypothetical protein